MTQDFIGLRLPAGLARNVEIIVKTLGYTSAQEFIREAIRNRIETLTDEQRIAILYAAQGSAKGHAKLMTPKVREKLARELYPTLEKPQPL